MTQVACCSRSIVGAINRVHPSVYLDSDARPRRTLPAVYYYTREKNKNSTRMMLYSNAGRMLRNLVRYPVPSAPAVCGVASSEGAGTNTRVVPKSASGNLGLATGGRAKPTVRATPLPWACPRFNGFF